MAARHRGEDIIDMSMGNPDGPTPQHIVDKLVEAAQREDTHGYSVSKGIPRLRKAICDWYKRRHDVEFDPESEAIVTIGSKEGLAHLMLATLERKVDAMSQIVSPRATVCVTPSRGGGGRVSTLACRRPGTMSVRPGGAA